MKLFLVGGMLALLSIVCKIYDQDTLLDWITVFFFVYVFIDVVKTKDLFKKEKFYKFTPELNVVMKKVLSFFAGYLGLAFLVGVCVLIVAKQLDMDPDKLIESIRGRP